MKEVGKTEANEQYYNRNVPNYYYQKPDNSELIQKAQKIKNGGGVPKAPKAVTLKVGGCPDCGKKTHTSKSKC
jgi:hypothetical protein